MKTLEQRMKALEEMVAEIHARVVMGKTARPGEAEYWKAIDALISGDKKPMDLFLQRGGELPEWDPSWKPFKPYVPRKRKEPSDVCGNREGGLLPEPVKLPEKERGASSVNRQL